MLPSLEVQKNSKLRNWPPGSVEIEYAGKNETKPKL